VFETLKLTREQHFYRYHSLLLNVHWGELKLEHLVTISGACETLVREHGSMSSVIVMRGEFSMDLSSDMRRAGANLTTKFEAHNLGQAMVIEADGFRSSMARSVITAVNLLARSRARQRVFKDPLEGVLWLCALEGQPSEIKEASSRIWPAVQRLLGELPP
jgi:hypothetical protein